MAELRQQEIEPRNLAASKALQIGEAEGKGAAWAMQQCQQRLDQCQSALTAEEVGIEFAAIEGIVINTEGRRITSYGGIRETSEIRNLVKRRNFGTQTFLCVFRRRNAK